MTPKILIIGSTGTLGSKLINFCSSKKIKIDTITCFKNINKLQTQKKIHKIKNQFSLSKTDDINKFKKHIKINKFNIIYFLDHGPYSLNFLDIILKNNSNSIIAIANKEMLIVGGNLILKKIKISKNKFVPLDSEHFSLQKINFSNKNISKIYITASGGPFYFKKNINLNKVSLKLVLNHPKWKMGYNNSIDSSNFINKILEIFELSYIYEIDLSKIDFLISREAYIHSIVEFKDGTTTLNCFNNDMLITLTSPLSNYFSINNQTIKKNYLDISNLKLETFKDRRFKIYKYYSLLKNLNHKIQIKFLLLNKIAQKQYLNGSINYNYIMNFIFNNLKTTDRSFKLNTFQQIIKYVKYIEKKYDKNN